MINDAKEIQAAQISIITNGDDSVSFPSMCSVKGYDQQVSKPFNCNENFTVSICTIC